MKTFAALVAVCALTLTHPAQAALRHDRLWTAAQAEAPKALETLKALVNIETPSREVGGMAELGDLLAGRLTDLGAQVEKIPAIAPAHGSVIVGRFTGTGQAKILLIAHMDTIYPAGSLAKRPFKIEGGRAYGPGIADDKSGVTVILHSLAALKTQGFCRYGQLTVMFNTDEEQTSVFSGKIVTDLAGKADVVMSFEPSTVGLEIIPRAAAGNGETRVIVTGRAAHAGAEPERGRNALVEAADIVLKTRDLDDPAKGFRFNWTQMTSGTIRNQIPDQAVISADTRHMSKAVLDDKLAQLAERLKMPLVPDTTARVDYRPGRPGYVADPPSNALIDKAVAIYNEVGGALTPVPAMTASSDAGYAQVSGKPVIEGFGLPGYGYHSSEEEYVDLTRMAPRIYLTARMIMELSGR
ncbi:MAG: carboxypeptidase [Phenylobacterium zucineum]|nr:MAG: carboxypeptidase [Phenylobacterium zucineum]